MILGISFVVFCVWILFLGGAEKLENSIGGYISFGRFGESSFYIKAATVLSLIFAVIKWSQ